MLACVTLGPVGQTIAFSCAVCAQNDFQSASFPGWLEDRGRRWMQRARGRPWEGPSEEAVESATSLCRGGLPRGANDESGAGKWEDEDSAGVDWKGVYSAACDAMERMRSDEDRNGDGQLQDADADTVARAGADAGALQVWSAGKNAC